MSVAQSECVFVALGIQHAIRMRLILTFDLSVSATFSTLSHKRHDFRKELLNKKCVYEFLYSFFLEHFSF